MAGSAFGQGNDALFGQRQAHGYIDKPEINEASGLVASVAHRGCFWTHNDSGDEARVFLVDDSARCRATYNLAGITAYDWEDIAMMERDGVHYFLIGEIGDNRRSETHTYELQSLMRISNPV